MWMPAWVRRRPLLAGFLTFLVAVFFVIPTTIAGAWSFWSEEPFAQMAQRQGLGFFVIGPYYGWFSVVLVIACGGLLCVLIGVVLKANVSDGDSMFSMAGQGNRDASFGHVLDSRANGTSVTFLVGIKNLGPTDTFFGEIEAVYGIGSLFHGGPVLPVQLKWQGTNIERLEIVSGQTRYIELFVLEHQTDENGHFHLPTVRLLSSHSEGERFPSVVAIPKIATHEVSLWFEIKSIAGRSYLQEAAVATVVSGKKVHHYDRLQERYLGPTL